MAERLNRNDSSANLNLIMAKERFLVDRYKHEHPRLPISNVLWLVSGCMISNYSDDDIICALDMFPEQADRMKIKLAGNLNDWNVIDLANMIISSYETSITKKDVK